MFEKRDRGSVPVRAGKSVMVTPRAADGGFVNKWWNPIKSKLSEADDSVVVKNVAGEAEIASMRRECGTMEVELQDLNVVLHDSLALLRELELRRIDAALHIKKTARHAAKWRRAVGAQAAVRQTALQELK